MQIGRPEKFVLFLLYTSGEKKRFIVIAHGQNDMLNVFVCSVFAAVFFCRPIVLNVNWQMIDIIVCTHNY